MINFDTLTINFENCEYLIIPKQYVEMILMYGIKHNEFYADGKFFSSTNCESLYLRINKDYNQIKFSTDLFNNKKLPFNRLNDYKDIVTIELSNENERKEYTVNYYETKNGDNKYQHNELLSEFLRITISAN